MSLDPSERVRALNLMRRAPWLRKCDSGTLENLLHHASLATYKKSAVVAITGERNSKLSIVLEGSIELNSGTAHGRRFVYGYVPPGEPIGFVGLFDGKGGPYELRAHEACVLIDVPKVDVMDAMQGDVQFMNAVLRLLAQRTRELHASLFDASMLPLSTRLARRLVSLMSGYGVEPFEDGKAIGLRISQDDLASMIGVTRQRLNIELKRMERERMLKVAYTRLVVLDEPLLRAQSRESAD